MKLGTFFSNKFKELLYNHPKLISNRFKKLSADDVKLLTASISEEEICNAIWSCGSDKASGPDGFTFNFLKHY